MVEIPAIFDSRLIRGYHARRKDRLSDHNFLIDRATLQLAERLGDITRDFPVAAMSGDRCSEDSFNTLKQASGAKHFWGMGRSLEGDDEWLPFAPQSLDLYISNFTLHTINDLPGALIQIRRALKPDGLFLAALPGGETLFELRQVLQQAEMEIKGGLSPRVHPFATKQDMGSLLQRAGFALPVVDSEKITVTYDHIFKLMDDLRGMGSSNALTARHKTNPGKELFLHAGGLYAQNFSDPEGRIEATVEIIYLIGWAPHESQPKPLRPGSAKTRLADALGVQETKL